MIEYTTEQRQLDWVRHQDLLGAAYKMHQGLDQVRHYHTWRHVAETRSSRRTYEDPDCSHRTALGMAEDVAIAFHDVIYVVGAPPGANEDMSALLLEHLARQLAGAPQADEWRAIDADQLIPPDGLTLYQLLPYVCNWIRHTKIPNHLADDGHHELDGDTPCLSLARILDADLCALAFDYDVFSSRQLDIVREQVPGFDYLPLGDRIERLSDAAHFLCSFLKKEKIYRLRTDDSERKARANIEKFGAEWALAKWSVVEGDNFCGDYPDEKLVVAGLSKVAATLKAEELNKRNHEQSPRWYRIERDGYELQPGFEP